MSSNAESQNPDGSPDAESQFKLLVSKVRHDLRSPLGHVLGFSEMLIEEMDAQGLGELRSPLNDVVYTANQLIARVNQILDWQKVDIQKDTLKELDDEIASGAEKVGETARTLLKQARESNHTGFVDDFQRIIESAGHLKDVALTLLPQIRDHQIGTLPETKLSDALMITPDILARRVVPIQVFDQAQKEDLVMVVDDSAENRELLRRRLTRIGYRVQMANNGQEAPDYLRENDVDLILLDIMMPVLDGFQTLIKIKEDHKTRHLPVIMLSQADEIDIVVYCIKLGADDFLPQPINTTLLIARMESSLAKKHLREIRQCETPYYFDQGTLQPDSPSYVERQSDVNLLEGLSRGEFCYVLTSRQMGKSSLMVRTAYKLREDGVAAVVLDLAGIGQNLTPEQWYDGLTMRIARQLRLEDELEDYWNNNSRLGPVQRFFQAIRDVLINHHPQPLVIFVDELDTVRSLPFKTDEFFAAIRQSYNYRTEDQSMRLLTFCLLGVATPSDLVKDVSLTPFNFGRRIELQDFTEAEAASLRAGLGRDDQLAQSLLTRVFHWTSGHPYLTQRMCRTIAQDHAIVSEEDVDKLCQELFLSPRCREEDDNLVFVRRILLEDPADAKGLLEIYEKICADESVRDDDSNPLIDRLHLTGLVRREDDRLLLRNLIYTTVFPPDWIRAQIS